MARKKKTIAQEVEKAAVLLQKLVRLKAANFEGLAECVTCGKTLHWQDLQGGHFIGRKWLATKIMEENIHPQCRACNGPKRGNMIQYTLYMQDTYGRDFVEELERLKHESRKFYRDEIKEIQQDFRRQIERIQTEKGL